jgi:HAD superfamily hydrolase (TIGR01490 family)
VNPDMLESGPLDAKVLSVFDFDGTLTHHDSFVPFLRFSFGRWEFSRRMLKLAVPGARFLLRRISRDELKAQLIRTFMTGVEKAWVEQKAEAYCQANWARLMRPAGVRSVEDEVESGAVVTLCSASPALVLQPFANRLGIKLIGTELEVVDGVLTGRLTGNNCRCENKVLRLEAVYGDLGEYRLRAWGDTRGDRELLAAAQDAHFRHFHSAGRQGKLQR